MPTPIVQPCLGVLRRVIRAIDWDLAQNATLFLCLVVGVAFTLSEQYDFGIVDRGDGTALLRGERPATGVYPALPYPPLDWIEAIEPAAAAGPASDPRASPLRRDTMGSDAAPPTDPAGRSMMLRSPARDRPPSVMLDGDATAASAAATADRPSGTPPTLTPDR